MIRYVVWLVLALSLGACYEDSRNTCANLKWVELPSSLVNRPSKIVRMSDAELALFLAVGNKEYPDGLLNRAVSCGNPDTVEVLLRRGADVEVRDRIGRTPFLRSMRNMWDPEISLKLLAYGADPTVAGYDGWNVLHYAAQHNVTYIFDILDRETLLRVGPNAQNHYLESPLHLGVRRVPPHRRIPWRRYEVSFLRSALQEGIFDKSLQNNYGQTAYDLQLDNLRRAYADTETCDPQEQERILRDLAFDPEALERDLAAVREEQEASQPGAPVEAQPMPQVGALVVQVPES